MLIDYIKGVTRVLMWSTITVLIIVIPILTIWVFIEMIDFQYLKQMLSVIAVMGLIFFLIGFIQALRELKR